MILVKKPDKGYCLILNFYIMNVNSLGKIKSFVESLEKSEVEMNEQALLLSGEDVYGLGTNNGCSNPNNCTSGNNISCHNGNIC